MKSKGDQMEKKDKIRAIKVFPEYPENIGRPKYCNFVQVKFTPNEYMFDFGFVDPIEVNESEEEINAMILSRICMNHGVAKSFLKAFQENMEKFNIISSEIKKLTRGKDE